MQVSAPMCVYCKHLDKGNGPLTCRAFPDGVPEAIYTGQVDHRQPYDGDNGTQFEPANAEAQKQVEQIFKNQTMDGEMSGATKGGLGSGNFRHRGRPGHVGGSAPSDSVAPAGAPAKEPDPLDKVGKIRDGFDTRVAERKWRELYDELDDGSTLTTGPRNPAILSAEEVGTHRPEWDETERTLYAFYSHARTLERSVRQIKGEEPPAPNEEHEVGVQRTLSGKDPRKWDEEIIDPRDYM